jgi:hypothetical protein
MASNLVDVQAALRNWHQASSGSNDKPIQATEIKFSWLSLKYEVLLNSSCGIPSGCKNVRIYRSFAKRINKSTWHQKKPKSSRKSHRWCCAISLHWQYKNEIDFCSVPSYQTTSLDAINIYYLHPYAGKGADRECLNVLIVCQVHLLISIRNKPFSVESHSFGVSGYDRYNCYQYIMTIKFAELNRSACIISIFIKQSL